MLTQKEADRIFKLYNECRLAALDEYNSWLSGDHNLYEMKLHQYNLAKARFRNYIKILVKRGDKVEKDTN